MYKTTDIEKELSFIDIKIGIKSSLISLISVQLVFQIFTLVYIQIISYFPTISTSELLSPRGLNYFAWDMWLMIFLLSSSLVGYSILKKTKDFPLYLLLVYPASLVILSMVRDVSFFQVIALSLLSCAAVLKFNYQRVTQLYYSTV